MLDNFFIITGRITQILTHKHATKDQYYYEIEIKVHDYDLEKENSFKLYFNSIMDSLKKELKKDSWYIFSGFISENENKSTQILMCKLILPQTFKALKNGLIHYNNFQFTGKIKNMECSDDKLLSLIIKDGTSENLFERIKINCKNLECDDLKTENLILVNGKFNNDKNGYIELVAEKIILIEMNR